MQLPSLMLMREIECCSINLVRGHPDFVRIDLDHCRNRSCQGLSGFADKNFHQNTCSCGLLSSCYLIHVQISFASIHIPLRFPNFLKAVRLEIKIVNNIEFAYMVPWPGRLDLSTLDLCMSLSKKIVRHRTGLEHLTRDYIRKYPECNCQRLGQLYYRNTLMRRRY